MGRSYQGGDGKNIAGRARSYKGGEATRYNTRPFSA
jgi:hypothetical protein